MLTSLAGSGQLESRTGSRRERDDHGIVPEDEIADEVRGDLNRSA
jgi:hypothetical protein